MALGGRHHNESERLEEYLECLFKLEEVGGSGRTKRISKELGISQASVTEMLGRLARDGYILYSPRRGAKLTKKGARLGRKMVRRHRILEFFLYRKLGVRKLDIHEEACRMEHSVSGDVERRLVKFLGNPSRCPDDNMPIPHLVRQSANESDVL